MLIVDSGNTNYKFTIFKQDNIVGKFVKNNNDADIIDFLKEILQKYQITKSVYANTFSENPQMLNLLKNTTYLLKFVNQTPVPIKNIYRTPNTLGLDRIANIIGAYKYFEGKNCMVIDIGTAITYDFLVDKTYVGGYISLGLDMRYKALNNFTAKLPLLQYNDNADYSGLDTNSAIQNGVVFGVVLEVESRISQSKKKIDDLQIILTGGGAKCLLDKLKNIIFVPDLLSLGLKSIFEYNFNNNVQI